MILPCHHCWIKEMCGLWCKTIHHTVEDFKAVSLMQGGQFGNISKEKFALDHLSKQLMGS